MPTAAIYYRNRGQAPDFVLIDGEESMVPVVAQDESDTAVLNAVARACRNIGYEVMPGAPIVRQADGRGTIRVRPVDATIHAEVPAEPARYAEAFVGVGRGGRPGRAYVGGNSAPLDREVMRERGIPEATAEALRTLGYKIVSPLDTIIADNGDGMYSASCKVRPTEWRDDPTIVRVNDTAATALNDLAATLSIPADELASAWIIRAATDAKHNHARWSETRYIDATRILGWAPEGHPHLREV